MTTRQARTLSALDHGHTITGTDTEGTYFHGVLGGGNYAGGTLTLQIGRQQIEVPLDQELTITKEGAA